MKKAYRKFTSEEAKLIRQEYSADEYCTIEYLAHKYDRDTEAIRRVLSNQVFKDHNYTKPVRKSVGKKKKVFIPQEIIDMKDERTPTSTTAHRARGQNRTINKFA